MSQPIQTKRKQSYVDSHVQGAILKRICSHWLILFAVSAFIVILLQTIFGDQAKTIGQRIQHETGEFACMAVVMIMLFPAFMLDTIRFSNRFVGPISRIRRQLRKLGTGKTDHCTFRTNDFWSELADEFNDVADLVESQKQEITELRNQLKSTECPIHS